MIRKPISKVREIVITITSIALLLGAYEYLSYRQHKINPYDKTIPSFTEIAQGCVQIVTPNPRDSNRVWLWEDAKASLVRFSLGMLTGVSLAFLFGIAMGVSRNVEAFCKIPILALGAVPPTAMLAVFFVLFGVGMNMFVAMIVAGIFPSLATSIYNASRTDVTDHSIYKAYTLGASDYEVIWEVVVKQIFPRIIDNIRLIIPAVLICLIAAEWATAGVGFGYRLKVQSRFTEMTVVYPYLVVLGVFNTTVNAVLLLLRKKLCPWFDMKS